MLFLLDVASCCSSTFTDCNCMKKCKVPFKEQKFLADLRTKSLMYTGFKITRFKRNQKAHTERKTKNSLVVLNLIFPADLALYYICLKLTEYYFICPNISSHLLQMTLPS